MYLKDANYIALRRARVARCWKESVMGRTRTSSPATVGELVARLQWVMCRIETALRLTSFAQGLEPRKERNAAPARVSCELF